MNSCASVEGRFFAGAYRCSSDVHGCRCPQEGLLQPGEQVPEVPLPGVRAALPVAGEVVGKEPVEYPGIAGGEVPVEMLDHSTPAPGTAGGHPCS